MAITTKTPVRTVFDASNAAIGLAEFQTDEVVSITHGGTGGNSISSAKLALSLTDSNIRSLFSISGGSYDNATGIITVSEGGISGVTSVGGATGIVSNAQIVAAVVAASSLNTANVTELTNLYFTNARVYSNVTQIGYATNSNVQLKANVIDLTTANVTELTNLYYTNARVYSNVTQIGYATNSNVELKANVIDLTTANVIELNSLYFTDARARQAISTSGCTLSYSNTTGILSFSQGNTDTISEGSTNLYYTDARVYSAVTGNLNLKANLTSPSFTGTPQAPTAVAGTSNTMIATTAFVATAVTNLIDSAPAVLDTLNELAAALGNDNNFSATVITQLSNKANTASLTTANVTELTNLYFTNARAILAEIPAVTQLAVTASGSSAFLIDSYSGDNPSIYVTAGETISFSLNVTGHPFMIRESAGGSNYSTGLTHIATDGTETTDSNAQSKVAGKLFWKVPFSLAGNTYVYQCSVHAGMVGNIVINSTTSTGTGNVVLSTSPILVTPNLGTPTSGTLSSCTVDGTDAVGFRNIPINSKSTAYTTVLTDSGKAIFHPSTDTTARTFTIPSNANVAYALGTALTFINMTSNVITIAIAADTMYLSSAGTTGSRSLAQYGSATAIKITSTNWLISGSGLT